MASGDGAELAELLRGWRERALLTQEQLAERAQLSVRTIRRLESGHPQRPYAESIRLLANALGLTDDDRTMLTAACREQDAGPPRPASRPMAGVPRQLPMAVPHFVGRAAELARLTALAGEIDGPSGAVVISAIDGTAGVGKTALALYWAHQAADRFPDGQLYVNLRGFDPTGAPMRAADAIHGLLHALGVDPQRIPTDLDARAGLYRSLLCGRRALVLLDNARDADQVRPLLPGGGPSLVLVTSRNRLSGLAAAEGARTITLDLLTAEEARLLLARRLGPERLAGQRRAVDDLVARCAHLPLALAIVAARAEARPGVPLAELAAELASGPSLDALDTGDRRTRLGTVLSWSYGSLSDGAARLFRLLGVHPGPDATLPAMASLVGQPVSRVRPLLDELARGNLVTEHAAGRFTFHDLLRAYAVELASAHDSDAGRLAALHRVLDHYLHNAHAAAMVLDPHRHPIAMSAPPEGIVVQHYVRHEDALAWFAAEHAVLLAAVRVSECARLDAHTWQLAWTLMTFLEWRGRWDDWIAITHAALDAARRVADRTAEARIHRSLGRAHACLRQYDDAHTQFRCALDLYRSLGDRTGLGHTHLSSSSALSWEGRHGDSVRAARTALRHYRVVGDVFGQAAALNNIGWGLAQQGDHRRALVYCGRALSLKEEVDDARSEANTWDSLGYAHRHLGHRELAITCYQRAVDLLRASGDRYQEADTLNNLGDLYHALGDPLAAQDAWRLALDILDQLGLPGADRIRAKLAR